MSMKKRIVYIGFCWVIIMIVAGCKKMLVEEPRSVLTASFLSTPQGYTSGLDAAYAGSRLFWGNQDYFTVTVIGTDEFQRGVDGNNDINVYNSSYTPSHGTVNANWRNAYTFINTANAVIDNTPKVNL